MGRRADRLERPRLRRGGPLLRARQLGVGRVRGHELEPGERAVVRVRQERVCVHARRGRHESDDGDERRDARVRRRERRVVDARRRCGDGTRCGAGLSSISDRTDVILLRV